MDLQTITQKISAAVGDNAGIGKVIALDFGDAGQITIDGASVPNRVSNEPMDADTTVKLSLDDLIAMSTGSLDPMMAFMMGKLKVEGDMMLAQKLIPLLKG